MMMLMTIIIIMIIIIITIIIIIITITIGLLLLESYCRGEPARLSLLTLVCPQRGRFSVTPHHKRMCRSLHPNLISVYNSTDIS